MMTTKEEYLALLREIQDSGKTTFAVVPSDEPRFLIDTNTREINVPSEFSFLAVQYDHCAETIYFEIDRYFDNVDLSEHTCVIQFRNKGNTGSNEGYYHVKSMDIESVDGKILFGWTIENTATLYAGDIEFSVRFYSIDDKLRFSYNFNTIPSTSRILHTLDSDYKGTILTPSELEEWLANANEALESINTSAEKAEENAMIAEGCASSTDVHATNAAQSATSAENSATLASQKATEAGSYAQILADSVNTHFPLIKKSGTFIQENYIGNMGISVVANIEAKQSGEGDPSPSNIRPITGMSNICVSSYGENMFAGWVSGGIGGETGIEVVSSTSVRTKKMLLPSGKSVYITGLSDNLYSFVAYYDKDMAFISRTVGTNKAVIKLLWSNRPTNAVYFQLTQYENENVTGDVDNVPQNICISIVENATFTPYDTASHTIITLPETSYGGYIDLPRRKYIKTHSIFILNGTENVIAFTPSDGRTYFYIEVEGISQKVQCSHYPYDYSHFQYCVYGVPSINWFIFGNAIISEYSSVDTFKTFLSNQYANGTPVTVVYKLSTPVEYDLADLPDLITTDGINTVHSNATSLDVEFGHEHLQETVGTLNLRNGGFGKSFANEEALKVYLKGLLGLT